MFIYSITKDTESSFYDAPNIDDIYANHVSIRVDYYLTSLINIINIDVLCSSDQLIYLSINIFP